MATTRKQDNQFVEALISDSLLEEAIVWMQRNLSPEDVFNEEQLKTWASENGYVPDEE